MRLIWKIYLSWTDWKVKGQFPYHLKKSIVIVAPHTSAWDFIIGVAIRSTQRLNHIKFLGKKELFRPPFGFLFRWLGGYPIDRSHGKNQVDQVVDLFNSNSEFSIALSPEGTRKRVDRLKTGFYHIAKKAHVPIVMAALDYKNHQVIWSEPFTTTDNQSADFNHILNFFRHIEGKIPDHGMMHL
jgi:1-acyl-sn-glycerol-3-phosphate acyltransferase